MKFINFLFRLCSWPGHHSLVNWVSKSEIAWSLFTFSELSQVSRSFKYSSFAHERACSNNNSEIKVLFFCDATVRRHWYNRIEHVLYLTVSKLINECSEVKIAKISSNSKYLREKNLMEKLSDNKKRLLVHARLEILSCEEDLKMLRRKTSNFNLNFSVLGSKGASLPYTCLKNRILKKFYAWKAHNLA